MSLSSGSWHPNKLPISGKLATVNRDSDACPIGARDKRTHLIREVVLSKLDTIIGMGINTHPSFSHHNQSLKIGVITQAQLVEDDILIEGYLYQEDFPGEVEKVLWNATRLGMSYEMTRVKYRRINNVWLLTDFFFTGASILYKNLAAYKDTWITINKAGGQNEVVL